MVVLVTTKLLG